MPKAMETLTMAVEDYEKVRTQTSGIPEMKESESQWLVPVTEVKYVRP